MSLSPLWSSTQDFCVDAGYLPGDSVKAPVPSLSVLIQSVWSSIRTFAHCSSSPCYRELTRGDYYSQLKVFIPAGWEYPSVWVQPPVSRTWGFKKSRNHIRASCSGGSCRGASRKWQFEASSCNRSRDSQPGCPDLWLLEKRQETFSGILYKGDKILVKPKMALARRQDGGTSPLSRPSHLLLWRSTCPAFWLPEAPWRTSGRRGLHLFCFFIFKIRFPHHVFHFYFIFLFFNSQLWRFALFLI